METDILRLLSTGLIILVLIMLIIGLIIAFSKFKYTEDEEEKHDGAITCPHCHRNFNYKIDVE